MINVNKELKLLAQKYIWWKRPEDALKMPERVIAQVMNIGDFQDVGKLMSIVDQAALKSVLKKAEAGQFSERSWAYWHYKLDMIDEVDEVPPMPVRKFS